MIDGIGEIDSSARKTAVDRDGRLSGLVDLLSAWHVDGPAKGSAKKRVPKLSCQGCLVGGSECYFYLAQQRANSTQAKRFGKPLGKREAIVEREFDLGIEIRGVLVPRVPN